MKRQVLTLAAAVFAAGTLTIANAAVPPATFVDEPVASTSKPMPDDLIAAGILQALNSDETMKNSKITVAPENGLVYLTGSTKTKAQKQKATEIAIAQAGEGNVVNTIADDET